MFSIYPLNLFLTFVLNSRSWLCKSMWAMWVVMWPLPGPVPKIELDDWMCTAFPRKMILSHLWQVFQVKSSYFPWVSHSANLYLKTGFAPELEAMWRRTQHCKFPPPPNCCSLHVLKRSSSRSCHQQIQSPWQQWSPPNHSKYIDNTFEGDLHSPAAGARLTHCTVLAAHLRTASSFCQTTCVNISLARP